MKKKYLFFITLTPCIAILPFFLISCSKHSSDITCNRTEVFENEIININFINISKKNNYTIVIANETQKNNFDFIGWNKNIYKIKYTTPFSVDTEVIIEVINGEFKKEFKINALNSAHDIEKTSCNEFIKNRTIYLQGSKEKGNSGSLIKENVYGTAWLYKYESEYKFEIITNWHVYLLMNKAHFKYLNYSIDAINYYNFPTFNPINNGKITYQNKTGNLDMYIFEVDFGNNSPLKDNFDTNIIPYATTHNNYCFELYTQTDNTDYILDNKFIFCGGIDKDGYIFTHSMITLERGYKDKDWTTKKEGETIGHFVDSKNYSIGNEFIVNIDTMDELKDGTSGSMCVTYDNDKVYLIGIHWGYWDADKCSIAHSFESFVKPNQKTIDDFNWIDYDLSDISY